MGDMTNPEVRDMSVKPSFTILDSKPVPQGKARLQDAITVEQEREALKEAA